MTSLLSNSFIMGMRQNIELKYESGKKIYLYSHWGGSEDTLKSPLAGKLRKALMRNERWDDEVYLARIIFSEVVRDSLDEETGTGLSPYAIDEEFPTIRVDLEKQTVNDMPFKEFVEL